MSLDSNNPLLPGSSPSPERLSRDLSPKSPRDKSPKRNQKQKQVDAISRKSFEQSDESNSASESKSKTRTFTQKTSESKRVKLERESQPPIQGMIHFQSGESRSIDLPEMKLLADECPLLSGLRKCLEQVERTSDLAIQNELQKIDALGITPQQFDQMLNFLKTKVIPEGTGGDLINHYVVAANLGIAKYQAAILEQIMCLPNQPEPIIQLLRLGGHTQIMSTLHVLLDNLSTDDLQLILSEKNENGIPLWSVINQDTINSLSTLQCLRLIANALNIEGFIFPEMLRFPDFVLDYYDIFLRAWADDDDSQDVNDESQAADGELEEIDDALQAADGELQAADDEQQEVDGASQDDDELQLIKKLSGLDLEEKAAALAYYIESEKIGLAEIENDLSESEFLRLAPYLRYADLRNFGNVELAKEILRNCSVLNELRINDDRVLEGIRELPQCRSFKLRGSTGLTRLPELPQCRTLICKGCTGLTRFPELPQCKELKCLGCTGLTHLPELPQCQRLDCTGCIVLTALPALPKCYFLNYSNCPGIRELPELPFNATVVSESSMPFQKLKVDVEQFSTNPYALLLSLGGHFFTRRPFPNVCYFENGLPSEAIDVGGVRRDFITRLCENLFKKDFSKDDQGKFLHLRGGLAPEATEGVVADVWAYRTLGVIFALCCAGGSNFKTGPLFHESVYEYVCSPGVPESNEWFLNALLRKSQLSSPEGVAGSLINPKIEMPQLGKKDLERLAELLDQDVSKCTQDYFANNQEEIARNLVDLAREDKSLLAVSWMAMLMYVKLGDQAWSALIGQGAKVLQESVEGIITADALKAKLKWEPVASVSIAKLEQTKAYLNSWIDHSPIDRLSLFVRAVTGNKTLCAADLNMQVFKRGKAFVPIARTCFYSLELSCDYETQEEFNQRLEKFLEYAMAGSGFSIA